MKTLTGFRGNLPGAGSEFDSESLKAGETGTAPSPRSGYHKSVTANPVSTKESMRRSLVAVSPPLTSVQETAVGDSPKSSRPLRNGLFVN